jgi:apolipoprotein N-acyltransferase
MTDSKKLEENVKKYSWINRMRPLFAFPKWQDASLAILSAVLLILAFPDFEIWWLAWFALVPLLIAVERNKDFTIKCFYLGLLAGTIFFYGSCWWLTYAPINYGKLPAPLIYLLLVPATLGAGFFTGVFSAISGRLLSKFGHWAIFLTPFVWTACEFLRLLITGNAWNALGYSLAFKPFIGSAAFGGVFLVSFLILFPSVGIYLMIFRANSLLGMFSPPILFVPVGSFLLLNTVIPLSPPPSAVVIGIQPNVPMSGLTVQDYYNLRQRHVEMAEAALREIESKEELKDLPKIVVFPESPMLFGWAHDSEFREFAADFTRRNRTALIFNAGEPTTLGDGYHNSAIMVSERGEKIAQYDKIRLVPFGEFVPDWIPFSQYLPTVVGRAKPGKNFRLMPFGSTVRAGVLICYESAFGDLSNGFVRNGADVLVEMTNDGYGGDTPILRQHLANAVFRAVETNRPLLRVTNVGITAYINERGEIRDGAGTYTTATRIWTVSKSDGKETFYVRNGDLFAWICTTLSLVFLGLTFIKFETQRRGDAEN